MKNDQDTGAAATLKRWEQQELKESQSVADIEEKLNKLRKLSVRISENALQARKEEIKSLEWMRDSAIERWEDTSKVLLSFERGVAPEKREGEKMLVSEVESLLENTWRADRIAQEAFGLSIAQDAIRCADEQQFYTKYQESLRQCRQNGLRAGIENSHFPKWVIAAFERSL